MLNKINPVNLDLTSMKFPLTAIASILHRISGVLLFLLIPFMLLLLERSLSSAAGFHACQVFAQCLTVQVIIWLALSSLVYHLIAGIKHLLMDMGYFEEKQSAKVASLVVLLLAAMAITYLGVWLWVL